MKRFDYKWIIVILCCMMVFTTLGFCSSTKSQFEESVISSLFGETEVDDESAEETLAATLYSLSDSIRFISTSVANIFFGFLVAKLGAKLLISLGFLSLIGSMLVYSFAPNIYVYYTGALLLGVGLAFTTTTMIGYVVNRWAKRNKGTIMGIALASNGVGGALAVQIVTPIINKSAESYRDAYRLIAVILFAAMVLMLIFFRNSPKVTNEEEMAKSNKKTAEWEGYELKDIMKKPYFYISLVCVFFTGMALQGINGIGSVHMRDVGLAPGYVSLILSFSLLLLTAGKFLTGFFYDRFGIKVTSFICTGAASATMLVLAATQPNTMGKILCIAYAILVAFALPLETIMLPIYAGEIFGKRSYNKMLGIFVSVNTAGYAFGPPLVHICKDLTDSFFIAIVASGVLMVAVMICMYFVIRAANKDKKSLESAEECEIESAAK